MAEAGDGSGHTPLTREWTPAPRASHYPWQGDRPTGRRSFTLWTNGPWTDGNIERNMDWSGDRARSKADVSVCSIIAGEVAGNLQVG